MQRALGTMRGARRHGAPSLSVVIASSRWSTTLGSSVAMFASQCEGAGVEVILVCPSSGLFPSRSAGNIRFIDAAGEQGIEELRALGMRGAAGDIVVMADPAGLLVPAVTRSGALHP